MGKVHLSEFEIRDGFASSFVRGPGHLACPMRMWNGWFPLQRCRPSGLWFFVLYSATSTGCLSCIAITTTRGRAINFV